MMITIFCVVGLLALAAAYFWGYQRGFDAADFRLACRVVEEEQRSRRLELIILEYCPIIFQQMDRLRDVRQDIIAATSKMRDDAEDVE